ncbi:MAG TPA: hypothetical protein VNC61_06575 [Acidimicrobiales bacterium]|nr:hypothetical protein [Acidimicrobiales bacterium]
MMRRRRLPTKLLVLSLMVATPLVGLSGSASAVKKGSAGWCAAHPAKAKKLAACSAGAAGGGAGGAGSAPITIQIDPSPVVETSSSAFAVVVQVEASPSFAGDLVDLSSSQLDASCAIDGFARPRFNVSFNIQPSPLVIALILDDEGNATTSLFGENCAPGTDVIEADMTVAPFDTALGTLTLDPPNVTPPGLFAYPTSSGTVTTGEVATGDTANSGDSDVYAVFTVETDPVYAEQPVEIEGAQLESRCLVGYLWGTFPPNGVGFESFPGGTIRSPFPSTLDDDGNATFVFVGRSCAAGTSEVIADVEAGTHPTYVTTFTIDPPAPTI